MEQPSRCTKETTEGSTPRIIKRDSRRGLVTRAGDKNRTSAALLCEMKVGEILYMRPAILMVDLSETLQSIPSRCWAIAYKNAPISGDNFHTLSEFLFCRKQFPERTVVSFQVLFASNAFDQIETLPLSLSDRETTQFYSTSTSKK